jgi:uncharacterized membrane protein
MMFKAGRTLLALAIGLFGLQQVINGKLVPGFFLTQAWTPALPPVAYVLGVVLIVGAVGLFVPAYARGSALALIGVIGCGLIAVNAWYFPAVYADGIARMRFLEPFAIGAVLLIVAAALGAGEPRNSPLDLAGRMLYASSLVIFGLQHLLYAGVLATLVPNWIPLQAGIVYVTGAAFIAAGFAIGLNTVARTAALGIAAMFAVWVVLLHVPRVAAAPGNGAEWASLFVAVAMCGCGLIVASVQPRRRA